MPDPIAALCDNYNKRLSAEYKIHWQDIPLEGRGKNQSSKNIKRRETTRIVEAVPSGSRVIALDERGKQYSSSQFAVQLEQWLQNYKHVSFVIGGPDGLDFDVDVPGTKQKSGWADDKWALSNLTFPHALVRVMLVEQVYRAWSLKAGHPYHRE